MKTRNTLLIALLLALSALKVEAQLQKAQASYIYNFTRFIEWPIQPNQTVFTIGVLGKNHEVTKELKASSATRSVGTLPIKIEEFATFDLVTPCQILFVPREKISSLKKLQTTYGASPMILITEAESYTPTESAINFFILDSKLAFKINANQLKQKNLKVSEKLLSLAK